MDSSIGEKRIVRSIASKSSQYNTKKKAQKNWMWLLSPWSHSTDKKSRTADQFLGPVMSLDSRSPKSYIYLIMSGLIFNRKLWIKDSLDVRIIAVALLYYLAARLGYFFAFDNTNALPAWPPSGIAFALIIMLGRQTWPGIAIGCLVANIMAFWNGLDIKLS